MADEFSLCEINCIKINIVSFPFIAPWPSIFAGPKLRILKKKIEDQISKRSFG